MRNDHFDGGLQLLHASLKQSPEASFQPRFTWFLGELAQELGRVGQVAQGLETIDEALAQSERSEERWCVAELLRIKGEQLGNAPAFFTALGLRECLVDCFESLSNLPDTTKLLCQLAEEPREAWLEAGLGRLLERGVQKL